MTHSQEGEKQTKNYLTLVQHDPWLLQVAQDTFALGEDIPLRMIHIDGPAKTWDKLRRHCPNGISPEKVVEKFLAMFKDDVTGQIKGNSGLPQTPSHWDQMFPMWEKILPEMEETLWLTRPSNPFHLTDLLQRNPEWCFWEVLWTAWNFRAGFSSLEQDRIIKNRGYAIAGYFGLPELHAVVRHVPVTNSMLLVGPLFTLVTERITGGSIHQKRVLPLIERFNRIPQKLGNFCPSREILLMAGSARLPMTEKSMRFHAHRVTRATNHLMRIENIPNDVNHLRQCENASLAEWVHSFVQLPEGILKKLGYDYLLWCRFDHSDDSTDLNVKANLFNWLEIKWSYDEGQSQEKGFGSWCLHLRMNPEELAESKGYWKTESGLLAIRADSPHKKVPIFLAHLEAIFTDYYDRISNLRTSLVTRQSATFRDWLRQGDFNLLSNEVIPPEAVLLTWVMEAMRSDTAALYRMSYSENRLMVVGTIYQDDVFSNRKKDIQDYLDTLGIDDDLRQKSICYRVVDTGEQQMCRDINSDHGMAGPPLGFPEMKSAIATPILVHGRVWGVLEVNGVRRHQFRWVDRTALGHWAHLFGTFLYQGWYRGQLHKLNAMVGDIKLTPRQKYDSTCAHLSEIFMSFGCTLWLREMDGNYYTCHGVFNRSDIQEALDQGKSLRFDSRSPNSLSGQVIREAGCKWKQFPSLDFNLLRNLVGLSPLPEGKIPSALRPLSHLTVIAIRSPSESETGAFANPGSKMGNPEAGREVIATISFHNVCGPGTQGWKGYAPSWEGVVEYVMHHMAMLLEKIEDQSRQEMAQRRLIDHDIKNNIALIVDRLMSMEKFFNLTTQQTRDRYPNNSSIYFDIQDVLTYAEDMRYTLQMIHSGTINTATRTGNNSFVVEAESYIRESNPKWMSIKEQFNRYFPQIARERGDLQVEFIGLTENLMILIHPPNLQRIFFNLAVNVRKYAIKHTEVRGELIAGKHVIDLVISNLGPMIEPGEANRLPQRGFRARCNLEIKGEGMGLYIVQEICRLYEHLEFRWTVEPAADGLSWYRFTLRFGNAMIQRPQRRMS